MEQRVTVRLNDDELAGVDSKAKELGYNRSEAIRFLVRAGLGKSAIPKSFLRRCQQRILLLLDSHQKRNEMKEAIRNEVATWL